MPAGPRQRQYLPTAGEHSIFEVLKWQRVDVTRLGGSDIPSKIDPVDDEITAEIVERTCRLSLHHDWWELEPFKTAAAWDNVRHAILRNDPHLRGVVMLGLGGTPESLAASFALAAYQPLVKGFAVGQAIFGDAARAWMRGAMDDNAAVDLIAGNFARLCRVWDEARDGAREQAA